ncbi:hypothetical protein ACIRQH_19815 [Streptomyces sp. NPDC102279]|uniref:hypothetical protein n=1 Tax=Streptomyces sp. NPDC102279 TaxID=3366153 RepID=UPI003821F6CD
MSQNEGQRRCPLCGQPLKYLGDVDTTAMGHEGREQQRGSYKCVTEECDNFESIVNDPI